MNVLNGDWILVSPQRTKRPWEGKVESLDQEDRTRYDPNCYLCPGNERAGGRRNPPYKDTFVFTNDFAALLPELPDLEDASLPLFQTVSVRGNCRVICFSARHDLTLAEMEIDDIRKVVNLWLEQMEDLGRTYRWVQIFENKGEIMGCSNPHPHGQIWASNKVPGEPLKEDTEQADYLSGKNSVLLMDYLAHELEIGERIIVENEYWVVLVPYWATWPFETILLPRRHVLRLPQLSEEECAALAVILKNLLVRYDNLFETSFPYTMGWHGAPTDNGAYPYWQLHGHFYPPLLRSATVKKFMVGYEMLAEVQRDITPEQAAAGLKSVSETHHKLKG